MRTRLLLGSILLVAVSTPASAQIPVLPHVDDAARALTAQRILAHTLFLSDDLLEGRGPGTRGERLAQAYLTASFAALGLEPAGDDGSWLQPFDLVSITTSMPDTLIVQTADPVALAFGTDWVGVSGRQTTSLSLDSAELVFVGYGIVAPEASWDDYKDVDVSGKVLLFLNNDPVTDAFGGQTRMYYGRWTYKYEIAARRGAVGAIIIHTTPSAGYPWQVVQVGFAGTEFELPAEPGEPRVDMRAWVSEQAARRIVTSAGFDLDRLVADAQRPDFRPQSLGATIDLDFTATLETVRTANVLARLPGRDASRAADHVVYTAHYDHLGVGDAVDGDAIYNGARDNALGTATMLTLAAGFVALPEPPARSILFAAVGAEEQGLLGSEHLAHHPPVPVCRLVANINIDGGNIWGTTLDVRQIGGGKSELDHVLSAFAAEQGRTVLPEEFPDRGYFYRSDQFSLAQVGVPALYLDEGVSFTGRPEGWGVEQIEAWTERDYHQPSDEVTDAWDLSGAAEDAALLFRVGYAVAEAPDVPRWTPGDEFAAERAKCDAVR